MSQHPPAVTRAMSWGGIIGISKELWNVSNDLGK
jgi:hypothetical protein